LLEVDGVAGVLVVLVQEVDGGEEEEREHSESGVHPKHAFLAAVVLSKIYWLLNEEQEEKEVLLFASF